MASPICRCPLLTGRAVLLRGAGRSLAGVCSAHASSARHESAPKRVGEGAHLAARVIDDFVVRHSNQRDPPLRPPRLTASESRAENWSGFPSPHTRPSIRRNHVRTSLKRYGRSSTASSAEIHRRSCSGSRLESNGAKRRRDRIGLVRPSWEQKPSWRMCSPEFSTTFRIST